MGKVKRKVLWGLVLSLTGFLWFAKDMGWINIKLPIIPLIIFLMGVWLIIEGVF